MKQRKEIEALLPKKDEKFDGRLRRFCLFLV
jgi:hypothetical protein